MISTRVTSKERKLLIDEQLKTLKLAFVIIFKHTFYLYVEEEEEEEEKEEEKTKSEEEKEVQGDDNHHL